MESLKNSNGMDMFYMYVIPGFSITNESQSNFVVQNIKFVFQNLETHPFLQIHPFYWQNFWPNPFYKFEISFTPPFLKGGFHTVTKYTSPTQPVRGIWVCNGNVSQLSLFYHIKPEFTSTEPPKWSFA